MNLQFGGEMRVRCTVSVLSERKGPIVAYAAFTISPDGNLSRYLREIHRQIPWCRSAKRANWRGGQKIGAAHQFVIAHLRLVAKIAIGYRGYSCRSARAA